MECNILLLKPDTCNQNRFRDVISRDLVEHGFEIISETSKELDSQEVNCSFIVKNKEHRDYMLSGPVIAMLYRGQSAVGWGRNYKFRFRKKHKIDEIRNVLHTTEPGNEFATQFKLFFPDLNIADYHQYADQGVFFERLDGPAIDGLRTFGSFNLVAENEQVFDAREFREIGRFENCRYLGLKESIAQSVDMVTYYVKRDTAGERPRQVKVLLLHDVRDCDQMLSEFAEKYSINGVVCYKPSYSLLETETLRSVVFESKLFCVGGSFGEEPAGCIRVSAELEEIFSSAQ